MIVNKEININKDVIMNLAEQTLDSLAEPLALADKTGKILFCNESCHELQKELKLTDVEDLESIFKHFTIDDNSFIFYWHKLWQERGVYFNVHHQMSSGRNRRCYSVGLSLINFGNLSTTVLISFRDYTYVAEKERQLREANEFNKRILEIAPVSILVLDNKGKILITNDAYHKITGYPIGERVSDNLFKTDTFQRSEKMTNDYRELLKNGKIVEVKNAHYISKETGKEYYLDIIAVPLVDKNGNIDGALSIAKDRTELYVAKAELEELNKELRQKVKERTQEVTSKNKDLNQAIELKDAFISDASHELRTPLTIMRGNIDLAIRALSSGDKNILGELETVVSEIGRMSGILKEMSFLVNGKQGEVEIEIAPFHISELIKDILKDIEILAREKKILLQSDIKFNDLMDGDEKMIEKMIFNLLTNAIKYNKRSGWIMVKVRAIDSRVSIEIEDNGVGIPEDVLPNIFERFYRVDKARSRQQGGSGLGLAIVKSIVEKHNGSVNVYSKEGVGTKFSIKLPVKQN
jgi:PAS domain S-box-containing protein